MAIEHPWTSGSNPIVRIAVAVVVVVLHLAVGAALMRTSPLLMGQGEPQIVQIRFVDGEHDGAAAAESVVHEAEAESLPEPAFQPDAEPESIPAPEPQAESELVRDPEPLPEPDSLPEPEPTPEPEPVPEPEPTPEPKPEPQPKPQPKPKPEPAPQPEPKPKPKPQPQPTPERTPAPVPKARLEPRESSSVAVSRASPSAPDAPATPASSGLPSAGTPSAGAQPEQPRLINAVDYLHGPPTPTYPRTSQRLGEEGRVVVRVLINTSGRVDRATVRVSSGFSRLDDAAVTAARRARFRPYTENGVARPALADIPFDFKLR